MLFKDIKEAFYNGARIKRKGWEYCWKWECNTIFKVNGKEWFNMCNTAYKRDVIDDISSDDWEFVKYN